MTYREFITAMITRVEDLDMQAQIYMVKRHPEGGSVIERTSVPVSYIFHRGPVLEYSDVEKTNWYPG